jgi:hypothetical protein
MCRVDMNFEILKRVNIKFTTFWDVMSFSLKNMYERLGNVAAFIFRAEFFVNPERERL